MMGEEIADGCEASDLVADIGKVERNARHLLGLINDVLDLSKVESGKMEVYVEDFAVEDMYWRSMPSQAGAFQST